MDEKRSEEISANQPESGRLEEDAEAAEQETPPQPPEPLSPQQSLAAQPPALLSPPEAVRGDAHERVMVSQNMVVETGGEMACDGIKRDDGVYAYGQGGRAASAAAEISSSHSYLVLPTQTRSHPQCQQVLMRATSSGRSEAMIFWFLFWEAAQQQGRLRLKNVNRREARAIASRRAIGSEKALALVGPAASSGVGGTRRLVGALPVRGEHVSAKRGDATIYRVSRSKGMYYFHVPQQ